jgi:hypothetical protein
VTKLTPSPSKTAKPVVTPLAEPASWYPFGCSDLIDDLSQDYMVPDLGGLDCIWSNGRSSTRMPAGSWS